eukprot:Transcript_10704.p3 GENE.Transcript_10704~~Transcript_10704.p3  ORF type:complete len:335 (-),score=90.02 Transcript_10704:86-1090(-)
MRGCQRFAPAAVRYAVAYSEQLGKDGLFATRLWGEPLVLYRSEGDVVCVRDSCPHRSAPLSMGEVQDGVLRCFYHGWGFGAQGKCVAVPTIGGSGKVPASYCATNIATVERDGVLWVWRGNPLTADASKLPRVPSAGQTLSVDTTLDYGCEWTHIMESSLLAPHTEHHPLATVDDAASRFDAPNVAYHQGSSGAVLKREEAHVVPISSDRTRVMLRQEFEHPLLSALLQVPGSVLLLTWLVREWNYKSAHEKYAQLAEAGTVQHPRLDRFREWHRDTLASEGQPYFTRWDAKQFAVKRYGPQIDDDSESGTVGLKKNYVQNNPTEIYAPLRASS